MLLSGIIVVLLALAFRRGYRRGLVLQVLMTVGYLVVWLIARIGANPLAQGLSQIVGKLSLDSTTSAVSAEQSSHFFLNGIAFSAILTIGYFVVRKVAFTLNKVTWLPVIHQVNSWAGGLINVVIRYVIVFLLLNILILLPISSMQRAYHDSTVAQWMVHQTPGLSKQVVTWWTTR